MIKKLDKNIKVLAITGYNTDENRKEIMKAGADGYLPKPFQVKEISRNIKKILGEEEQ